MPDLSADRPPAPPEEPKSFTEEDVEAVADLFCTEADGPCNGCRLIAKLAFTRLAAAGRLLPASAEHREERWRVVVCDPDGTPYAKGRHFDSRDEAVRWAEDVLWVNPGDICKVERRILGPWVEVDGPKELTDQDQERS